MKGLCNQSCFVFVDCAIWIFFDLEDPFAANWLIFGILEKGQATKYCCVGVPSIHLSWPTSSDLLKELQWLRMEVQK